jgi:MFS superfamily sulfate permease-like transporter
MHALHELVSQLHADGQQLAVANPSKKVRSQMKRVDVWTEIGEEWVFVSTAEAVKKCQKSVQKKLEDAKMDCEVELKV